MHPAPRQAVLSRWHSSKLILVVVSLTVLCTYGILLPFQRTSSAITINGQAISSQDVQQAMQVVRQLSHLNKGQSTGCSETQGNGGGPADSMDSISSKGALPAAAHESTLVELQGTLHKLENAVKQQAKHFSSGLTWSSSSAYKSKAIKAARDALGQYTTGIPKVIHQVYGLYHDKTEPYWFKDSKASFQKHNPDYTYILWEEADVDEFVEAYFPAASSNFRRLKLPVLKADLARYLIIYVFGGVYSDVDTVCLKPVERWSDGRANVSIIVGIEADGKDIKEWYKHWGRQLQLCQWTFAAVPGHPVLSMVVYRISQKLSEIGPDKVVVDQVTHTTGPTVWTDSLYQYMTMQGHNWTEYLGITEPQQIGDLYLLTITGFSPGVGHMGARETSHAQAMVQHFFKGTWTKQGARRLRV